jgi:hypothetical protein
VITWKDVPAHKTVAVPRALEFLSRPAEPV